MSDKCFTFTEAINWDKVVSSELKPTKHNYNNPFMNAMRTNVKVGVSDNNCVNYSRRYIYVDNRGVFVANSTRSNNPQSPSYLEVPKEYIKGINKQIVKAVLSHDEVEF